MSLPSGREIICADTEEMKRGVVLYAKNWLMNARTTHEVSPKVHVLNVSTGCVGSSVIGTVNLTCSIGESSTSSPSSATTH